MSASSPNPDSLPANIPTDPLAAYQAGMAAGLRSGTRKRRALQLALAGCVALLVVIGGMFAWWQHANAEARRAEQEVAREQQVAFDLERKVNAEQARKAVEDCLQLAVKLRAAYRFSDAEAALRQAAELAQNGDPKLLHEVEQARADLAFVVALDDIRMKRSTWVAEPGGKGKPDPAAAADYRKSFAEHGLEVVANPEAAAKQIGASPNRAVAPAPREAKR